MIPWRPKFLLLFREAYSSSLIFPLLLPGGLLLAHRPVLLRHRGLGEVEYSIYIRHEFHGFVHRIEFNGIVQEEKIRLVVGMPFHLADQRLLLLPIHGA